MSDFPKVNEVFTISDSLFKHIDYDFNVIEPSKLDILFISNYGERAVSPLISRSIVGVLPTTEELINIGSIIKSYYFEKWEHLKKLYLMDYDPLHNYLDELTETITGVDKEKVQKDSTLDTDMTLTINVNNTRTDNLSESNVSKSENTDKNNSDESTYGFNSSDAVKSDTGVETSNSTETFNGTKNNTGTQSNVGVTTNGNKGTVKQSNTNVTDDNKTQTRTSKHSGNIGNLTTQQLYKQELELRDWNFINSVLEDVKELLTLPIYM